MATHANSSQTKFNLRWWLPGKWHASLAKFVHYFCHRDLSVTRCWVNVVYKVQSTETVFVALEGNLTRILVSCVYRPPSAPAFSRSCLSDIHPGVEVAISSQPETRRGAAFKLVLTGLWTKSILKSVTMSIYWPPSTSQITAVSQRATVKYHKACWTCCWSMTLRL